MAEEINPWKKLAYIFLKDPNFEMIWPSHARFRALTVKGVYEVSYSRYVQIFENVCITELQGAEMELAPTVQNK